MIQLIKSVELVLKNNVDVWIVFKFIYSMNPGILVAKVVFWTNRNLKKIIDLQSGWFVSIMVGVW